MNWLDIFCFTSVARTRSFSITARELMISQQAVSRHIRTLEDELGFPLFLRNTQGVYLSQAGKRMLGYFAERERLMEEYKRNALPTLERDTLRVAWPQWLGCPSLVQNAIARFRQRWPGITLLACDLNVRELRRALSEEQVDVLIATRYGYSFLPVRWPLEVIAEEPIYLLTSSRAPYDPALLPMYIHIADSAGEPDEVSVRARLKRTLAPMGVNPQRIEVYPEMGSVCLNLLVKGGVALGIAKQAMAENPDFNLIPTPLKATVALAMSPHRNRTAADDFADLVREEAAL